MLSATEHNGDMILFPSAHEGREILCKTALHPRKHEKWEMGMFRLIISFLLYRQSIPVVEVGIK